MCKIALIFFVIIVLTFMNTMPKKIIKYMKLSNVGSGVMYDTEVEN